MTATLMPAEKVELNHARQWIDEGLACYTMQATAEQKQAYRLSTRTGA
jgi:hypothetical protein